jgi:hypothetical protein
MKANELMIGDWVHVEAHRGFNAQNVRVETIPDNDGDNEYGHHYGHIGVWLESDDNDFRDVEAKHLQPIPLTPEILEKNGFKSPMPNGMMLFSDKEKDISIVVMKTNNAPNCNGKYLVGIKQSYTDSKVVMNYVHQLQHALRLCGIDKTIEL